jgi:hypothetical protein
MRRRADSGDAIRVEQAKMFVDLEAQEDVGGDDGGQDKGDEYEQGASRKPRLWYCKLIARYVHADFVDDTEQDERVETAHPRLAHKRTAAEVGDLGAGPSAKRSDVYGRAVRSLESRYAGASRSEEDAAEASDDAPLSDDEEDFTVDPDDDNYDWISAVIQAERDGTEPVLFREAKEEETVWTMSYKVRRD